MDLPAGLSPDSAPLPPLRPTLRNPLHMLRRARSLPWRSLARWSAVGASVVGLGVLGVFLAHGEYLRVHQVLIEDSTPAGHHRHVTETSVRHLADVIDGTPLWAVDLDRAVAGTLRHPWEKSASASRRWPDTVVIRLDEHVVRLLLQLDALYYVDAAGEIIKRSRGDDLDYPVLTGVDLDLARFQADIAHKVLMEALAILNAVESSGEIRLDDVSEVHFDRWSGYDLILRSGTQIALGFSDPVERMERLSKMRAAGLDPSEPQRIDLAADQVAVATPYFVPASVLAPPPSVVPEPPAD